MQYINPNYHSWAALTLTEVRVDNNIINNVFVGIDKIDYDNIYVLINNYGSSSCINYINELKNLSTFNGLVCVDVDLVLFKFKVLNKVEYKKLIDGKYDEIDSVFHDSADDYIADCVRNTRKGFYSLYKMLFLILDNSKQLITDYWQPLFTNNSDWLITEIENSGKYFSAVSPNSNNLLTNYNNILKSTYEFSI